MRLAVLDVLRLSRAMTYKAACADLPLGGGKGVIALPPGTRLTAARAATRCSTSATWSTRSAARYLAAEDVGIGSRDMPVMGERTRARHRPRARARRIRRPEPVTAIGVEAAIRAVL